MRLKKGLAIALSFVMFASTLLMSFPNRAYASHDASWDPLNEWIPGNGSGTDPVEALLEHSKSGGHSHGGNGQEAPSPFQQIENPQAVSPDEPVDLASGTLKFSEKGHVVSDIRSVAGDSSLLFKRPDR